MPDREPVDEEELSRTVARLAKGNADHAEDFEKHPELTIRSPLAAAGRTAASGATSAARQAARRTPSQRGPALEMGQTLGEGGMGVVREAVQRSLDRQVAVKSLQSHFQHEQAVQMMLQEAHIMSHLEHPNVLPVYDLQYDDQGLPRIVLKKVEGTEWLKLIADGGEVEQRFGESDLLDWNLRVLMQVCNAVHFAHSRGIIHRDLKPENIMIGEFGEVYVMDWGLALSLDDDGSGRLPLAEDAKDLAGTPQYMAPEMVGGQQLRLGERTDVYLLGAMLYEVITGRPPHVGKTIEEVLASVMRSAPRFDRSAPPELAGICREAMDADPGWRHESAESLRLAINRFLQHRGSHRLVTQAQGIFEQLKAELAVDPGEDRAGHALRIYDHFGEARFAYKQALQIWPRNDAAAAGMYDAVMAMIDHEMANDNPHAAGLLASSLQAPDPEMVDRIRTAVERKDRQTRRLENLGRQLDPRTRERDRVVGAAVLGVLWTAAPLLSPILLPQAQTHLEASVFVSLILAGLLVWAVVGRRELAESAISRRLHAAAIVAMVATLSLELAGELLGLSTIQTQVLWPLGWAGASAMLAIAVDMRMLPMTFGFLGCLYASAAWSEQRFISMAAANAVMTLNMLWVWLPRERRRRPRAPEAAATPPDT